jgi:hypothetical protein
MDNDKVIREANRVSEFATMLAKAVERNDADSIALNTGRVHGACDRLKEACSA